MRPTMIGLLIASIASAWSPALAQERCEPAACLAAMSAKVAVRVADVPASAIAGAWKGGEGMLSGENLYLFPDGSYVYTEWADLLPETIFDRGTWTVDAGVVRFAPDAAIVWKPGSDRRYAAVTLPTRAELRLAGLDRSLETFLDLVREHPDTTPLEWLDVGALKRDRTIATGEAEALKRALDEESWDPGYFDEAKGLEFSRWELDHLLHVIDEADRVEALPVSTIDDGLGAKSHVDERPVIVDATSSEPLAQLLTGFDWSTSPSDACAFTPAVAFRFHRDDEAAQVRVSFECGEMVLDGPDAPVGGRRRLTASQRRAFLLAARKAFPGKFDLVPQ